MTPFPHLEAGVLESAGKAIRQRFPGLSPQLGLILGSGWSTVVDSFLELDSCDAHAIPGLGRSTVAGHTGKVIVAESHGIQTLIFKGRRHWYEGEGWLPVVLPIYLLKSLGAQGVLLTNASGGIRPDLKPGALILIRDHLNLMGDHPLRGPHQTLWGNRFPDMTHIYNSIWNDLITAVSRGLNLTLTDGIYAAVSGPSYETPAETRMLAQIGADIVGMSTVPEAIMARASGLKVAALSCVTNTAAGLSSASLSHDEVLAVLQNSGDQVRHLLDGVWKKLSTSTLFTGGAS